MWFWLIYKPFWYFFWKWCFPFKNGYNNVSKIIGKFVATGSVLNKVHHPKRRIRNEALGRYLYISNQVVTRNRFYLCEILVKAPCLKKCVSEVVGNSEKYIPENFHKIVWIKQNRLDLLSNAEIIYEIVLIN